MVTGHKGGGREKVRGQGTIGRHAFALREEQGEDVLVELLRGAGGDVHLKSDDLEEPSESIES